MNKDHYQVLGVAREADLKTIKSAYKALAKKYHPDISKEENAEEKFKEIAESYDVLSNPEKREHYDRFGDYDNAQFSSRYQQGDYYSGVNSAEFKFFRFKELSFIKKLLISIFIVLASVFILVIGTFVGIMYLIMKLITSLFGKK